MSSQNQAAGCVVWCGLVAGGAAVGVLLVLVAELVWPTQGDGGGAIAGAGVIGMFFFRAAFAALVGAIIGGAVAAWTVSRFRRGERT